MYFQMVAASYRAWIEAIEAFIPEVEKSLDDIDQAANAVFEHRPKTMLDLAMQTDVVLSEHCEHEGRLSSLHNTVHDIIGHGSILANERTAK